MSKSKIDVHHHVYPPVFAEALTKAGGDPSGWYIPPWTVEIDRQINDAVNIGTPILSVTAPGPAIVKDAKGAASLARACNEYVAGVRDASPAGRYGFFASLPSLFDTAACLTELAYALDVLHADGVTLFTRYGPANAYLGHEAFAPVWEELNRRKAVVFVHPTHAVDPRPANKNMPLPLVDYPHETGRTAVDMILSGATRRYADCKIILSHAGGTLPWLIHRVVGLAPFTPTALTDLSQDEVIEEARRFYFDTALSGNDFVLGAILKFAKPGHVLFGSDFPNAPEGSIRYNTSGLDRFVAENGGASASVYNEAALALFPRLKEFYAQ
ncbi:amidohydrolase family protein [Punctularia strigosozonata HHB-11173 SS5]|uniref:amidohydrolase family protein n=1 Tax=Punctularia strigosozonata (strain HHB-11173) TaxID=741275 RepID=UPI00044176B0|nr:amidohydrolase family protein [Punctularia strigosozonata HHB-11173 SS5]EIN10265.1 amidohydrolase family protein [Punctularia strigosozonata HHB-11173 SS5]